VTSNDAHKQIIPHRLIFKTPFQAGTAANADAIANQPGQSQRIRKPEKKKMIDTAKQILVRL
jgi:hypothetical protein